MQTFLFACGLINSILTVFRLSENLVMISQHRKNSKSSVAFTLALVSTVISWTWLYHIS